MIAGLEVRGLSVAFGGHLAVDGIDVRAPVGSITGLIGPNGAGKTTTFNACNGLLQPTAGAIILDGRDISRATPARRARLGLGRTFQRMEICEGMTVRENVALGRECRMVGGNLVRQFFSSSGAAREIADATGEALDLCGLGPIADAPAATLATGQRRLLELARVVCGGFRTLLLDEPSSGLDDRETARFGETLQAIVSDRDVGVLLVEHDMALVMSICEHIFVLDFGRLLFDGNPASVRASEVVRAAYLGADAEGVSA